GERSDRKHGRTHVVCRRLHVGLNVDALELPSPALRPVPLGRLALQPDGSRAPDLEDERSEPGARSLHCDVAVAVAPLAVGLHRLAAHAAYFVGAAVEVLVAHREYRGEV